jgi:predicted enzyme related to lactoylglutathione lyase
VPNSYCWNELGTNDVAKATDFYTKLFGWKADVQKFGPMEYTLFKNGERGAGGCYKLTPEMGNVPPHWLVYFAVDDCDAKTKKAGSLGVSTIAPPSDIPGVGRFAVIRDPQGAVFGIIKLINPPS